MNQGVSTTKTTQASSHGKDLLIVEGGSMMRSRMKQVKEAMRLLIKQVNEDTMFGVQNGASFMLESRAERTWINVIKTDENEAEDCFMRSHG